MARPFRRREPFAVLPIGAALAATVACVPAAERPSGDHPASVEAAAAPLPEPTRALGPRYAVDAGPVEPAVLAGGFTRSTGAGIQPSRPLTADAGAEGPHGH